MIKTLAHAQAVATRRQQAGLRGLPRAVVRFMARNHGAKTWQPTQLERADALNLRYNAPL